MPVITAEEIRRALDAALDKQAHACANIFYQVPVNQRAYGCSQEGCVRPAYAKRLCNAHYMRLINGTDLTRPLRTRRPPGFCWKCADGKTRTAKNGGWGLCCKHYKLARRVIMKKAAIEVFGGHCSRCALTFPTSAFDFHHRGDDKMDSVAELLANGSTAVVAAELIKCDLICANCHRVIHAGDDDEVWVPSAEAAF